MITRTFLEFSNFTSTLFGSSRFQIFNSVFLDWIYQLNSEYWIIKVDKNPRMVSLSFSEHSRKHRTALSRKLRGVERSDMNQNLFCVFDLEQYFWKNVFLRNFRDRKMGAGSGTWPESVVPQHQQKIMSIVSTASKTRATNIAKLARWVRRAEKVSALAQGY